MKMENRLRPKVEAFVKTLNSRFKEFISDQCLVSLLMFRLRENWDMGKNISRGQLVLQGEESVAYEAACPIFETILEHGCQVVANGHHVVAQSFARQIILVDPGTLVRTTNPNPEIDDWTDEALAKRKWNVWGIVITHHDSHGLCYDVRHEDGTEGSYDPSEIEILDVETYAHILKLSDEDKKILTNFLDKEVAVLLLYIKKEHCSLRTAVRDNFPEKY